MRSWGGRAVFTDTLFPRAHLSCVVAGGRGAVAKMMTVAIAIVGSEEAIGALGGDSGESQF